MSIADDTTTDKGQNLKLNTLLNGEPVFRIKKAIQMTLLPKYCLLPSLLTHSFKDFCFITACHDNLEIEHSEIVLIQCSCSSIKSLHTYSFIHSRIYIAPLQGNYSEVLPTDFRMCLKVS